MKKVNILIIMLLAISLVGSAQRYFTATLASSDTLTNTDTGVYPYTTTTLLDGIYSYSVTVANDSLSGSGTTNCLCQVSDDNTNWLTLVTSRTDSLTATADRSIVLYNDAGIYSKHFRLYCTHTGTGVDKIDARATFRRLNN